MTGPEKDEIDRLIAGTDLPLWQPNPDHPGGTPNPQRLAYESEADILGYGGAAGSGKSGLALGLAFTKHKKSVIFRRVYPNLKGLIEDSIALIGSDEHYNKTEKTWRIGGRLVEFGAVQYENDKFNWRGRPHDLYVFDEAPEFSRSQVEFIIGWLRSTDSGQRCRVVLTLNPPTDESGGWVIDYFLPWLAYLFPNEYQHPHPAAPGELRWYAVIDGKETEVDSREPFEHNGERIRPLSRTFIPAKLADNPHLAGTGYESVLQSLPEPLRSQLLYGNFAANKQADPWQVIPTEWVKAAQKRWLEQERPKLDSPTGVGIDAIWGGNDKLAISKRYDAWFDNVVTYPGQVAKDGPMSAELARKNIEGEPGYINVDVTGVGTSTYDHLKPLYKHVNPVNFSAGSVYRDRSRKLKMRNIRAEMYWRMRDALDPINTNGLALPPDNEVTADLCAARYKITVAGVQIEDKKEIKQRIGRSPDVGEAILLANLIRNQGWAR